MIGTAADLCRACLLRGATTGLYCALCVRAAIEGLSPEAMELAERLGFKMSESAREFGRRPADPPL